MVFERTEEDAPVMIQGLVILQSNSTEPLSHPYFNFSLASALNILEEHFLKDHIFEYTTETVIIICYALLMAAGLLFNLLVCSVVLSNNKIRSSRNVLVINLNVSDIILCVFCMPFTLMVLIRRSWILGNVLCKLVPFVQASTIFVSAATVLAIAVDRYQGIVSFNPQNPRGGSRDMIKSTILIWTSSLIMSIPICIFQGTIPVGLAGHHMYYKCVEMWPNAPSRGLYTVVILIAQFIIPTITLLVSHLHIKSHLQSRVTRAGTDQVMGQSTDLHRERLERELRRNSRATIVLFSISVVFAVSWLPWNGLNLLADFHPELLSPKGLYLAFAVCHMTAMSSSVTNPILYGWLNGNIRHEMVRMGWVFAKASSALVSNRSSHSENVIGGQINSLIRSSCGESSNARREMGECQV